MTNFNENPGRALKEIQNWVKNRLHGITRLEVIENSKRKYVAWDCKIDKSIQDDGKTLKLFVTKEENDKQNTFDKAHKETGSSMESPRE